MTSRFRVDIYCAHNGLRMTLPWRNEAEFKDGIAFLSGLVGEPAYNAARLPDEPNSYYLDTEDQFETLMRFRRQQVK